MDKLTHPAEYFATSNFVGEGLFLPTLLAPMAKFDPETFSVHVERILPDEPSHVRIGRDFIHHYCKTGIMQARVRRHATVVAKQYCLGYAAAVEYAESARTGTDPMTKRDWFVNEDSREVENGNPGPEAEQIYDQLVKEFDI